MTDPHISLSEWKAIDFHLREIEKRRKDIIREICKPRGKLREVQREGEETLATILDNSQKLEEKGEVDDYIGTIISKSKKFKDLFNEALDVDSPPEMGAEQYALLRPDEEFKKLNPEGKTKVAYQDSLKNIAARVSEGISRIWQVLYFDGDFREGYEETLDELHNIKDELYAEIGLGGVGGFRVVSSG